MKQLLDKILRPKLKQLIIFSFLISPFLIIAVHGVSFSWMFRREATIGLYIIFGLGLCVVIVFDSFRKTKLKLYALTAIGLMSAFFLLSYATEDFRWEKSEEQVIVLGEAVERYKLKTGRYPENLEDDFFNDSPKFAAVGSRFHLSYITDTTCCIIFNSFNGYTRCYNVKTRKAHSYD